MKAGATAIRLSTREWSKDKSGITIKGKMRSPSMEEAAENAERTTEDDMYEDGRHKVSPPPRTTGRESWAPVPRRTAPGPATRRNASTIPRASTIRIRKK